jgi:hypothetical protein
MSSSSLANWDGSQSSRNPKQSFKGDVRTLGLTSTGIGNDRTAAYLGASLTNWEGHRAVSRPGEGYNQGISSMARVIIFFGTARRVLMFFFLHCSRFMHKIKHRQYHIFLVM